MRYDDDGADEKGQRHRQRPIRGRTLIAPSRAERRDLRSRVVPVLNVVVPCLVLVALLFIPWEQIRSQPFVDRAVYMRNFARFPTPLEFFDPSRPAQWITEEIGWHAGVWFLIDDLGIPLTSVLTALSVFSAVLFVAFMWRRGAALATPLLLNPIVVDLIFSQYRLSLAIALGLLAILVKSRIASPVLVLAGAIVHTAFVLFALAWFLSHRVARLVSTRTATAGFAAGVSIALAVTVALALGPLLELVLNVIGDPRAGYGHVSSSPLVHSLWLVGLAFALLQGEHFWRRPVNVFTASVLGIAVLDLVFPHYPSRILAGSFAAIAVSVMSFERSFSLMFLLLYVPYTAYHWSLWL